jgi:hypothetical protein
MTAAIEFRQLIIIVGAKKGKGSRQRTGADSGHHRELGPGSEITPGFHQPGTEGAVIRPARDGQKNDFLADAGNPALRLDFYEHIVEILWRRIAPVTHVRKVGNGGGGYLIDRDRVSFRSGTGAKRQGNECN